MWYIKHAPVQTSAIAQRLSQPWMNEEIAEAKKTCWRAENLYRKDKSTENKQNYKNCCEIVKDRIQRARDLFHSQYWRLWERSEKLFQIVDKLLSWGKSSSLPDYNSVHTNRIGSRWLCQSAVNRNIKVVICNHKVDRPALFCVVWCSL